MGGPSAVTDLTLPVGSRVAAAALHEILKSFTLVFYGKTALTLVSVYFFQYDIPWLDQRVA